MTTTATGHRGVARRAGIAGVVWFVGFVFGAIVLQGEPPPYTADMASIKEFFATQGGRYLLGDYLLALAFVLGFLPFVAGLRTLLGTRAGSVAPQLVVAGGIGTVVVGGVATTFLDAVALARGELADEVVQALQYANAAALALLGIPAALFAASCALAIRTSGVLPQWLAAVGLLAAVLLAGGAAFVLEGPDGVLWAVRFTSFIALGLFVLAMSVCLLLGATDHRGTGTTGV